MIQQHEELLSETFLNGIMPYLEQNQIRLLGSRQSQNRTPTFALTMPNKPDKTAEGQSLIQVLNQNGILCTHGNHYAPDLVENCMNEPEGVTRISFLHYNSIADVNKVNFILSKFLDSCKNWTDNLKYISPISNSCTITANDKQILKNTDKITKHRQIWITVDPWLSDDFGQRKKCH